MRSDPSGAKWVMGYKSDIDICDDLQHVKRRMYVLADKRTREIEARPKKGGPAPGADLSLCINIVFSVVVSKAGLEVAPKHCTTKRCRASRFLLCQPLLAEPWLLRMGRDGIRRTGHAG